MNIAVVHPGEMGVSVAAAIVAGGGTLLWSDEGRSVATAKRALDAGLPDPLPMAQLASEAQAIVSVCPPHAAVDQAEQLLALGFRGLYVDANAIAPDTARHIESKVVGAGCSFVDGGLIGPPAWREGTTRLYLSGDASDIVADWFNGSLLAAKVLPEAPAGAASALKMAYAAWTKGSSALLLNVRALAAAEGVDAALVAEWALSQPGVEARSEGAARGTAPKAWRFVGEMEEIAASFDALDLPGDFHRGAAEVYGRMERFKDRDGADLQAVLAALLRRH